MKCDVKANFCFMCCVLSFLLSLITLVVTTLDLANVVIENEYLAEKIERLEKEIDNQDKVIDLKLEKQNKVIEQYYNYIDDISRCIVNGEW